MVADVGVGMLTFRWWRLRQTGARGREPGADTKQATSWPEAEHVTGRRQALRSPVKPGPFGQKMSRPAVVHDEAAQERKQTMRG